MESQRLRERAVEMLIVFSPLPAAMLLAWVTEIDELALVGVPTGVLLAWRALRLRRVTWAELGLRRPSSPLRTFSLAVPAAMGLLLGTALLSALLTFLTGWVPDTARFDGLRGNLAAFVAGLLLVWTTAAFGEELLFRGYLLSGLRDWWRHDSRAGWLFALLVSSAVFGLGHSYQGAAGVILTAAIGLGYGLVYLAAKRDLWAAILTHGFFDTAAFAIVFLSWDRPATPPAFLGPLPNIL